MRNDLPDYRMEPPDEPDETNESCRWAETDDGDEVIRYTTECGRTYEFEDDTSVPEFCPFCLNEVKC